MGEWVNVTFVKCADRSRLLAAVTELVAIDGYAEHSDLGSLSLNAREMQYGTDYDSLHWGFGFLWGETQWAAVKTAPLDLFARQSRKMLLPRLAHLCGVLDSCGIHISLQDGSDLFILECDAFGESHTFGCSYPDGEAVEEIAMRMHATGATSGQPDDRSPKRQSAGPDDAETPLDRFMLLPFLNEDVSIPESGPWETVTRIGERLTGLASQRWDNTIQVDNLIGKKPIDSVQARSVYFTRKVP